MSTISKTAKFIVAGSVVLFVISVSGLIYFIQNSKSYKSPSLNLFSKNLKQKSYGGNFSSPTDSLKYQETMIEYYSMVDMANTIEIDTTAVAREKSLSNLKDIGIYYWNRTSEVLETLNELSLPKELRAKTELMKEYCQINKKYYELMYKAIDERTRKYDDELLVYIDQIDLKLKMIQAE